MSRGLKIVLVISLVLNVFAIGAAAGVVVMRHRFVQFAGPPAPRLGPMVRAGRALTPDSRAAFRQAMRAQAPQIEPLVRQAREARLEAVRLFAAPTFDAAAATSALTRARIADGAARAQTEQALVAFAATLPPAERAAMGEALRGGGGRMRGPARPVPPDGPPPPPPAPGNP